MRNYQRTSPAAFNPRLFIKCSSFPPFVWELMECDYPNRLIAASRDMNAIHAAEALYGVEYAGEGPKP